MNTCAKCQRYIGHGYIVFFTHPTIGRWSGNFCQSCRDELRAASKQQDTWPLCVVPCCGKQATHRLTERGRVEFYCERHAGNFGAEFISRVWHILQQMEDEA